MLSVSLVAPYSVALVGRPSVAVAVVVVGLGDEMGSVVVVVEGSVVEEGTGGWWSCHW